MTTDEVNKEIDRNKSKAAAAQRDMHSKDAGGAQQQAKKNRQRHRKNDTTPPPELGQNLNA